MPCHVATPPSPVFKSFVTASQSGGEGTDITLKVVINDVEYISDPITANTGAGSNEIAANTAITLRDDNTNTSFQIQTGATAIVITDQTDLDDFAVGILQPIVPDIGELLQLTVTHPPPFI